MEAKVWPDRIDILGATAVRSEVWEPLLDELKAEHVPSLTPKGKRMFVVVTFDGRIDAFIYRTAPMSDEEVVNILEKYGLPATAGIAG